MASQAPVPTPAPPPPPTPPVAVGPPMTLSDVLDDRIAAAQADVTSAQARLDKFKAIKTDASKSAILGLKVEDVRDLL